VKTGEAKFQITGMGSNVGDWSEMCTITSNVVTFDMTVSCGDLIKTYTLTNGYVGIPASGQSNWVTLSPITQGTTYYVGDYYDVQVWSNRISTKLRLRRKNANAVNTTTTVITVHIKIKDNIVNGIITPSTLKGNEPNQSTNLYSSSFFSWFENKILLDGKSRSGDSFTNTLRAVPTSNVQIAGSFAFPIVTKTENYTATEDDVTILCNASSAPLTVSLPSAATCRGRVYIVTKVESSNNVVSVDTYSTTTKGAIWVQSDGATWQKIN
jgi:hypothetical protein